MSREAEDKLDPGLPTLCLKKSGNFAKCLTYALPQAIGLPRHRLFLFLSKVTQNFCEIQSKFLNSRVLAGGFVMGCAKKVLVLSMYKKEVEKSAV